MKKKILSIILCGVLFVGTCFSLCSCRIPYADDYLKFETEDYLCIYNEEKTEVTILELTKTGKEKEILVIPKEINDLPVVVLGGITAGLFFRKEHTMQSFKAKKLYLMSNLRYLTTFVNFSDLDIICFVDEERIGTCVLAFLSLSSNKNNRFYTHIEYESEQYRESIKKPDVFFYIGTELVWIDAINEDGLYYLPEDLKGTVWYVNEERTVLWNGNYQYPQGEESLNLYGNR